jgi:ankyrin repeat protein
LADSPDLSPHVEAFLRAIGEDESAARRVLEEHPAIVDASIHVAAAAADTDRVALMLERDRALANAPFGDDNRTPILCACASTFHALGPQRAASSLRVVELLLEHGADPNAYVLVDEGEHGGKIPALYFACVSNNVPVVRLLLERGAAVNDGESSYHSAQRNHRECLELLLAHGEDISSRHPQWNNTPLYFLAGHQDDQNGTAPWFLGFQWLLEHGADPNVWSYQSEETPLHAVATKPTLSAAVAGTLIAHGADVNRRRADGRTPFAIATRYGNTAVADRLRAHGASIEGVSPIDTFIGACLRADANAARALLAEHPSLVRGLAGEDRGMLAAAVWAGRVESVRLMIALGFDPSWRSESDTTPLHAAAWLGRPDMVRVLLEAGAPVNVSEDQYGSSPIGWAGHGSANCRAADDDYCEVVELLIGAGATVDASINRRNLGPQAMASPRVAKLLRSRGWA